MPEMQPMKPCARCEQELPEAFFESMESAYCRGCTDEMTAIVKHKYNAIEAALFRAKLRRSGKKLQERIELLTDRHRGAAAGD